MTARVTDEQARHLADSAYEAVIAVGTHTEVNTSELASDLLDARAEIATLKAVVNAAAALVDQWEVEHDCPDCEAKAEAMGGRCDPTCDICLERWAVAHDAYDDARAALSERKADRCDCGKGMEACAATEDCSGQSMPATSEGEEREYVAAAVAFSEARASYYQNPTVGTQQDLEDTWRDFRAARSAREGGKW